VRPAAATPAGPAVSAAHTGDVQAVTYGVRHGRTFLATGGRDGTVRVLDPDTGALLAPPLTGHDEVLSMAYATQKGVPFLMTCGRDGLRLWRPDSLTLWAGPHVPWEPTATNTWLPDGRQVHAVAQRNYELKVLDMATRTPMYPNLPGHVAPIRAVAFGTARGRWAIATGGDDNTIRLWDMFAGQPIGDPLIGHLGPVWGLSFGVLPDPLPARPLGFLASASSDGTVRLWDPDTGTPVHTTAADPLRAAGHHLPRRIDLGVPAYGVACAPPPGPARLAVVTEAGTVLLRLPAATPDNRRMP
jgi:WD40 repeat protein